jgi:hypothetical protein
MSQINLIYSSKTCFLEIHFNIILPNRLRSS